jgi:hypothetical protein
LLINAIKLDLLERYSELTTELKEEAGCGKNMLR